MNIIQFIENNKFKLIGSGNDGIVCINNKNEVIKILTSDEDTSFSNMNFDEASLAEYFLNNKNKITYNNIIPDYKHVGHLNNSPCIIRDDIIDIPYSITHHIEFEKLFRFVIDSAIFTTPIDEKASLNMHLFQDKWETTNIPEDVITLDEALELAESLIDIINNGIISNDISLENIGQNRIGQIKIRDFSRFEITEHNPIAWDYFNQQNYKNKNLINVIKKRNGI